MFVCFRSLPPNEHREIDLISHGLEIQRLVVEDIVEGTESLRNLTSREREDLFSSLMKKVKHTCRSLEVNKTTAVVVLQHYEWDVSRAIKGYNTCKRVQYLSDNIVREQNVEHHIMLCRMCMQKKRCIVLDCAHYVCLRCIRASAKNPSHVPFRCPFWNCKKYINFFNLPFDSRTRYICSLMADLQLKRNNANVVVHRQVSKIKDKRSCSSTAFSYSIGC